MAKENDPPGLLSKLGRFVRNPLTNWNELDQPELDKESKYSKQMLKEMIERKRRNDFVRKREFDQLRKLRRREASGVQDPAGRPSFFQSSYTTKPDDRAVTLKKIDEIEAQMSQQWWKTKNPTGASMPRPVTVPAALPSDQAPPGGVEATTLPGGSNPTAGTTGPSSVPSELEGMRAYATTVPAAINDDIEALMAIAPRAPAPSSGVASVAPPGFDAAALLGQAPGFVHVPELEEAAIRYANGDLDGTRAGLREAIAAPSPSAGREETWLTFFDFYRITEDQAGFESLAIDFASRFGRSAPAWIEGSGQGTSSPVLDLQGQAGGGALEWVCPEVLDQKSVDQLATLTGQAQAVPLTVRWDAVLSVHTTVLPALGRLFAQWCDTPMALRFSGAAQIDQFLRAATPSGDRKVDAAWWRLRLDYLRLIGQADEFELVALDYCVTYEVSPPSWQKVQCQYLTLADEGGDEPIYAMVEDAVASPSTAPSTLGGAEPEGPAFDLDLEGEILGDAASVLNRAQADPGQRTLRVGCARLRRVDFPAAGSILNWAAALQVKDCEVQFLGLNRLVAIFFNVIGINEHAKVLPRAR